MAGSSFTECKMRRTINSNISTLPSPPPPPSAHAHYNNNNIMLIGHANVVDDGSYFNPRKASHILLLLAVCASVASACYALGILLGSAMSATAASSAVTLRKQTMMTITTTTTKNNDNQKLLIDTDGMSRNDISLLKLMSTSAFLRGQVLDLMVKEYISVDVPDAPLEEHRENAIEALQFMETDSEPIQISNHTFLFVGSVGERIKVDCAFSNCCLLYLSLTINYTLLLDHAIIYGNTQFFPQRHR